MAEELKSGNCGSDADQEDGATREGSVPRASRSGPPSVSFPLLSRRELLQQHVDTELQQLEAGEIKELSLQTLWTKDVLYKSSPRGRQSAKTVVEAVAPASPPPPPPPPPTTAVASGDARQELPPPPQLQPQDRRTGPDVRNFRRVVESQAPPNKKRSANFATSARSAASREPKGNTGRWSEEEHKQFLRGYHKYGRDWVVIRELFVTTRTDTQIRTHAQKFFKNVEGRVHHPRKPDGIGKDNPDSQSARSVTSKTSRATGASSSGGRSSISSTHSEGAAASRSSGSQQQPQHQRQKKPFSVSTRLLL